MKVLKINTDNLCLLCLKEHVFDPGLDEEEHNRRISMNFSKLLYRLLGFKYGLQLKLCTDCVLLIKMISETFQNYEIARMKLSWRLQSLCDIIQHAESASRRRTLFRERVSRSSRKSARRLKTDIVSELSKCIKKLSTLAPRVAIPRLEEPMAQRSLRQFSSHPPDDLYMLSLLGCVVSFWIVISLSALNPEDIIKYAKYRRIESVSIGTNTCDMIEENYYQEDESECPIQITNVQTLSNGNPLKTFEHASSPFSLDETQESSDESVIIIDEDPVEFVPTVTSVTNISESNDATLAAPCNEDTEEYVSIDESALSAVLPSSNCRILLEDVLKFQNSEESVPTKLSSFQASNQDSLYAAISKETGSSPSSSPLSKRKKVLMVKEVMDDLITKFIIEKRLTKKPENVNKNTNHSPPSSLPFALIPETPFNESAKATSSDLLPMRLESLKNEPESPLQPADLVDSDASTICSSDPPSPVELDGNGPPSEFLEGLGLRLKSQNGHNTRVERAELKDLVDDFMNTSTKRKKITRPVSPKPSPATYCLYLICEVCKVQFESRAKIEKHRVLKHDLRNYVKCPLCSKMFDSYASLEEHREISKGCDVMEETKLLELRDMARPIFPFQERKCITGNMFCPYEHCYEVFSSEKLLNIHMSTHGNFRCQFCPETFGKAGDLALHECAKHRTSLSKKKKRDDFSCARCQFYGRVENEYIYHFIEFHLNIRADSSENAHDSACAFKIIKY